jgi:hypothetical protein
MKRGTWFWVTLSALASLALFFVLFRPALGLLFNAAFEYRTLHDTSLNTSLRGSSPVIAELEHELGRSRDSGVMALARIAARVTARRLHYCQPVAPGVDLGDPNSVVRYKAVNCQGYSVLFAAAFNYLLRQTGHSRDYDVRVATGRQALLGWEFQRVQPFQRVFPSHVYNVICLRSDGVERVEYLVDSNLYDYTGILFVRGRQGQQVRRRAPRDKHTPVGGRRDG